MYVEGKGLNKKLIKSFCFQLGKMFQVIPKLGGGEGENLWSSNHNELWKPDLEQALQSKPLIPY